MNHGSLRLAAWGPDDGRRRWFRTHKSSSGRLGRLTASTRRDNRLSFEQ